MILDTFKITGNDDLEQWEFTPKIDGFTSYTVAYSECDNKQDACIAVCKSLQRTASYRAAEKI